MVVADDGGWKDLLAMVRNLRRDARGRLTSLTTGAAVVAAATMLDHVWWREYSSFCSCLAESNDLGLLDDGCEFAKLFLTLAAARLSKLPLATLKAVMKSIDSSADGVTEEHLRESGKLFGSVAKSLWDVTRATDVILSDRRDKHRFHRSRDWWDAPCLGHNVLDELPWWREAYTAYIEGRDVASRDADKVGLCALRSRSRSSGWARHSTPETKKRR